MLSISRVAPTRAATSSRACPAAGAGPRSGARSCEVVDGHLGLLGEHAAGGRQHGVGAVRGHARPGPQGPRTAPGPACAPRARGRRCARTAPARRARARSARRRSRRRSPGRAPSSGRGRAAGSPSRRRARRPGATMWKSFDTTVSTPGEVARPHRALQLGAQHAGVTAVSAPAGYMSATPGREHQLDALLAARGQIGLQRAGVARQVLVRAELQRVHEDRDDGDRGPGHPAGVPDQLAVALVQRAHRRHERHPAARAAQGPRDRRDARRAARAR